MNGLGDSPFDWPQEGSDENDRMLQIATYTIDFERGIQEVWQSTKSVYKIMDTDWMKGMPCGQSEAPKHT